MQKLKDFKSYSGLSSLGLSGFSEPEVKPSELNSPGSLEDLDLDLDLDLDIVLVLDLDLELGILEEFGVVEVGRV